MKNTFPKSEHEFYNRAIEGGDIPGFYTPARWEDFDGISSHALFKKNMDTIAAVEKQWIEKHAIDKDDNLVGYLYREPVADSHAVYIVIQDDPQLKKMVVRQVLGLGDDYRSLFLKKGGVVSGTFYSKLRNRILADIKLRSLFDSLPRATISVNKK